MFILESLILNSTSQTLFRLEWRRVGMPGPIWRCIATTKNHSYGSYIWKRTDPMELRTNSEVRRKLYKTAEEGTHVSKLYSYRIATEGEAAMILFGVKSCSF